jgi:predicted negative regulator of RcsB-dependent stress response
MLRRPDRLLSRGQRALFRRDFVGAEALLREALTEASGQAPIHLYLAHALAEQGRLAEAERSLAVATDMAPASFVYPLHRGIMLLDAGDPARARDAFAASARLALDNRLVAGYVELAAWTEDGRAPSVRLAELALEPSDAFRARALLRLAETTLERHGRRAAVRLLEPPPEPLGLPFSQWLGALRYRDRLAYAEQLLGRERFDEAVCFIASQPPLMADPRAPALLERARRGALRTLDLALDACPPTRRGTLLLHRYEFENDLGDHEATARTLTEWRAAHDAAGAPAAQRHLAAAVTRRLASIEFERGRDDEALALCAVSRAARVERETAGIEALARLALGQRRAARYAFEDFLDNALFPLDIRLRAAASESAA